VAFAKVQNFLLFLQFPWEAALLGGILFICFHNSRLSMKYLAYIGAENGSTAFSGTVNRERQSVFFEWGIGVICSYFFTGHLSTLQPLSGSFPSDFFPFVLHLYSFWSHSFGLQDLTGVRSSFMFGWISDCNVLTPGWSCVFHFIFPLNLLMLISHFLIVLHLKNFRSYCFFHWYLVRQARNHFT